MYISNSSNDNCRKVVVIVTDYYWSNCNDNDNDNDNDNGMVKWSSSYNRSWLHWSSNVHITAI